MAVILNELFFPEADARAASLYSAIAYCATYVFRPIGALIFGWIGDTIGRKATVIITTFLMSLCYLIMANYKNLCRNWYYGDFCSNCVSYAQGMSFIGEVVGAELYLTEMTKIPQRYWVVASLVVFVILGATV
nr:MFS transporter [Rickettsia conorii]